MSELKPLVLDVDGTFLKTDILYENFWAALGVHPWATIKVCAKYLTDPAGLKCALADIADIRTDLLPVNSDIKNLADQGKAAGREVVLASASYGPIVARLATVYGLSTTSFGTTKDVNLKGHAKAAVLVEYYGSGGFDYAGDSSADRAVWEHAENAILVGHHPSAAIKITHSGRNATEITDGWNFRDLLRGIRPHQWVKNVLLLLPLIAAHQFSFSTLFTVLLGMIAFSAAASSIYIVNDLLDLEADRLHPKKKHRPFASGAVPIKIGMLACVGLGAIAIALGAYLNPVFLAVIITYMALSLAYSLKLKRMRWIDVATLAGLYTLRVIAGAAAAEVYVTGYMLVFIFPVFITLGCVKRLTELTLATSDERLPGRGYSRADRGDLLNVAILGIVGALLIFFAYSFTEQAHGLYPTQWMLWVALVPIAAWLIRMVRLGYFGKQDYDPIVFALRDKRGLGLLMITLSMMFYAAGLWQEWFGF